MTKKELLNTYRAKVIELEELRHQLSRVGTDGRPNGCRGMQTNRIAAGTNDPSAAAMQLADGLEDLLHRKEAEKQALGEQVDDLLREIRDFRTYIVIQQYYVLGWTDEQVARALAVSRVRVSQLRRQYLESA